MGPDVRQSVSERLFADLTDVTLADEDINSIPADDVNEQSQAMYNARFTATHVVDSLKKFSGII